MDSFVLPANRLHNTAGDSAADGRDGGSVRQFRNGERSSHEQQHEQQQQQQQHQEGKDDSMPRHAASAESNGAGKCTASSSNLCLVSYNWL